MNCLLECSLQFKAYHSYLGPKFAGLSPSGKPLPPWKYGYVVVFSFWDIGPLNAPLIIMGLLTLGLETSRAPTLGVEIFRVIYERYINTTVKYSNVVIHIFSRFELTYNTLFTIQSELRSKSSSQFKIYDSYLGPAIFRVIY